MGAPSTHFTKRRLCIKCNPKHITGAIRQAHYDSTGILPLTIEIKMGNFFCKAGLVLCCWSGEQVTFYDSLFDGWMSRHKHCRHECMNQSFTKMHIKQKNYERSFVLKSDKNTDPVFNVHTACFGGSLSWWM